MSSLVPRAWAGACALSMSCIIVAVGVGTPFGHAAAIELSLREASPPVTAEALGVAPWLNSEDDAYWQGPAMWTLDNRAGVAWAWGHAAVDGAHLHLRIEVIDSQVSFIPKDGQPWEGDAVLVALDARGDGVGGLPPWTAATGVDDALFALAAGKGGDGRLWRWMPGAQPRWSSVTAPWAGVERDRENSRTIYSLTLPWSAFETTAAVSQRFGLGVQICDGSDSARIRCQRWGEGAGIPLRPGELNSIAVGDPPPTYVGVGPMRAVAVSEGATAELGVVMGVQAAATIEARVGSVSRSFSVSPLPAPSPPSAPGSGTAATESGGEAERVKPRTRRMTLSVSFDAMEMASARVETRVAVTATQPPSSSAPASAGNWQGWLWHAAPARLKLWERLQRLQEVSDPLLRQHMEAAAAIVRIHWSEGEAQWRQAPNTAEALIRRSGMVVAALEEQRNTWREASRRGSVLIWTTSGRNAGSLRTFAVSLPPRWDGKEVVPLALALPAAPARTRLSFLFDALEQRDAFAPEVRGGNRMVILTPWCGGHCGEVAGWESAALDAMAEVRRRLPIDSARIYLVGAGLGGDAAWGLAQRVPDPWAALALISAGIRYSPSGSNVGNNLEGVPVWMWHGGKDRIVPVAVAERWRDTLRAHGSTTIWTTVPEVGHRVSPKDVGRAFDWLSRQVRESSGDFSFVSFDDAHRGRDGITMRRTPELSLRPRFEVQIRGRLIHVTSEGTTGLTVDLGPNGLGMSGEVELLWNGVPVYQGLPKVVELGSGGG